MGPNGSAVIFHRQALDRQDCAHAHERQAQPAGRLDDLAEGWHLPGSGLRSPSEPGSHEVALTLIEREGIHDAKLHAQ